MSIAKRALARVILLCLAALASAAPVRADWKEWAGERDSAAPVEVSQDILDKYDWELNYADGSGKLSFKDLAESGHPFVLVWWLSDCPVCHMQMPYVQKLQKEIEDNKLDVRIVSICIDQNSDDCLKYVREKGISFDVLLDPRGRRTDQKYRVKDMGTPVTYVFNKGGALEGSMSGFKQQYSRAVFTELGITVPTK
jgi:thiol-disulfide isomerase/thioredoxin